MWDFLDPQAHLFLTLPSLSAPLLCIILNSVFVSLSSTLFSLSVSSLFVYLAVSLSVSLSAGLCPSPYLSLGTSLPTSLSVSLSVSGCECWVRVCERSSHRASVVRCAWSGMCRGWTIWLSLLLIQHCCVKLLQIHTVFSLLIFSKNWLSGFGLLVNYCNEVDYCCRAAILPWTRWSPLKALGVFLGTAWKLYKHCL